MKKWFRILLILFAANMLGGTVTAAILVKQSGQSDKVHRDHLGSITAITNTDGTKIAEYSFDPWGRQRNPANQQAYGPDAAPSLLLGRGYTGHEHLPMFGLIIK
jgi:hypothetical protein